MKWALLQICNVTQANSVATVGRTILGTEIGCLIYAGVVFSTLRTPS